MRTTLISMLALTLVLTACGEGGAGDETTTTPATGATTTTSAAEVPTTTTAVSTTDDPACPEQHFLIAEVNAYEQNGYPDPELAVSCGATTFTVITNNIPNFEFVAITPNDLAAQDLRYEIPLVPTERDTPGAMGLGAVGVSVSGLNLFGAFEAPRDGYRDPYLDGLLDFCNGHTAPGGVYHFHARFDCLFADPTGVGLVYGYLFDGYEIVSPWVCIDSACTETRMVTSSYVRVDESGLGAFEAWEYHEGSGDLDECNGMTASDGVYRYYATDEFPYLPFCFHGVTTAARGDFDGTAPQGGPA